MITIRRVSRVFPIFGADDNEFLISLKSRVNNRRWARWKLSDAFVPDPSFQISGVTGADGVVVAQRFV